MDVTMHISLTPELENRVRAKVESGLYNNASEVIREALRFMDAHDAWVQDIKLALLREQLQMGIDQLDRGEVIPVDSKSSLDRLFDAIQDDRSA
jgi:antitoxin ParD1/3/4